jgi:hypothetical protein
MLTRLAPSIVVAIVCCTLPATFASPITYDFTGTFRGGTVNGSNQITGSFTINADPILGSTASSLTESGSDVSITVNAGGQTFNWILDQESSFAPRTSALRSLQTANPLES